MDFLLIIVIALIGLVVLNLIELYLVLGMLKGGECPENEFGGYSSTGKITYKDGKIYSESTVLKWEEEKEPEQIASEEVIKKLHENTKNKKA